MVQSSTNSPRGRPAPLPETPIAKRLEQVRALNELDSIKEFWRELDQVAQDDPSLEYRPTYSSARTYHFDRDPPLQYLVLVWRRFGVSLEWLATGEGPSAAAPGGEQMKSIVGDRSNGVSWLDVVEEVLRADPLFHELEPWPELSSSFARIAIDGMLPGRSFEFERPEIASYLRGLAWFIDGPWALLGAEADDRKADERITYVRAMLTALHMAISRRGRQGEETMKTLGKLSAVVATLGHSSEEEDDDG